MWGTRVRFLFVRARPTDLRIIVIFHDRQGILIDTEWEAHHTESIVCNANDHQSKNVMYIYISPTLTGTWNFHPSSVLIWGWHQEYDPTTWGTVVNLQSVNRC